MVSNSQVALKPDNVNGLFHFIEILWLASISSLIMLPLEPIKFTDLVLLGKRLKLPLQTMVSLRVD